MLKPSVVMPLLLETLLTFLKAHLPLTAEQSSIIDPSGPRRKVAPAAATAVAVPATAVGSATAVAAPGTQVRDTAVQGATSAMAPKASGDATKILLWKMFHLVKITAQLLLQVKCKPC